MENSIQDLRELFQVTTRRFGLLNKNCCSSEGISVSVIHSHILYEVSRNHTPSMQLISESLGIDATTFSRQIQKLIQQGLLLKTPNPDDKRIFILSLTEEGNKLVKSIDEEMNEYIKDIFSNMSEFEAQTVINSMEILNKAMAKTNSCC